MFYGGYSENQVSAPAVMVSASTAPVLSIMSIQGGGRGGQRIVAGRVQRSRPACSVTEEGCSRDENTFFTRDVKAAASTDVLLVNGLQKT